VGHILWEGVLLLDLMNVYDLALVYNDLVEASYSYQGTSSCEVVVTWTVA